MAVFCIFWERKILLHGSRYDQSDPKIPALMTHRVSTTYCDVTSYPGSIGSYRAEHKYAHNIVIPVKNIFLVEFAKLAKRKATSLRILNANLFKIHNMIKIKYKRFCLLRKLQNARKNRLKIINEFIERAFMSHVFSHQTHLMLF